MTQKVKDLPSFNGPFDAEPYRLQEWIKLPAAAPKGGDIADRTHGHFNEPSRIDGRLRGLLGLDDAVIDFARRLRACLIKRVRRIFAADPCVAEIRQESLDIGSILEAIGKASRGANTRSINPQARFQSRVGKA